MSHANRDTGDDALPVVRASELDDSDTLAPWLVEPQRVTVRVRMRPLTVGEVTLFLDKHLRAAGAKTHLFEPDAVTLVFQHSRRIPRLVQDLALGSLLATANKKTVDADAVQQALLHQDAS